MSALEVLLEEHTVILRAIDALRQATAHLENGGEVPDQFYHDWLDLAINFADRCHHTKEETVLFPLITQKSSQEAQNVSSLLKDHENGRKHIKDLKAAVAQNSNPKKILSAQEYSKLLTEHIKLENSTFQSWFNSFSEGETANLFEEFERIEEKTIGTGKHHEYVQRIENLKTQLSPT